MPAMSVCGSSRPLAAPLWRAWLARVVRMGLAVTLLAACAGGTSHATLQGPPSRLPTRIQQAATTAALPGAPSLSLSQARVGGTPAAPSTVAAAAQEVSAPEPAAPADASPYREPLAPRSATRIVVLMYHSVDYGKTSRSVAPRKLEQQIRWLRDHHVEIIRLSQLVAFLEGRLQQLPAKVAVITLDDGERTVFTRAFPIFRDHQVPFALGINTWAVEHGDELPRQPVMTWDQMRAMVASGLCEIANHTHTHPNLAKLRDEQRVVDELERARTLIEERTGVRTTELLYPFGATSDQVIGLAREHGFRAGFVAWGRDFDVAVPPMRIPRYGVVRETTLTHLAVLFGERR